MASTFTKIIRREIPAEIVHEDQHTIAFLDINPKAEGHTLVLPKVEVAAFEELPAEALHPLMNAVQVVARGIQAALGTPHYNLDLNNGAPAGQVIFHVHFHIIPRHPAVPIARPPLNLSGERMKEIAAKIREAIQSPS